MAFTTPSYSLSDLFSRVNHGELQLPDFQRSYQWNVDRIRSLIVSVLRGFPIGAFLALDTRNEEVRFKSRPVYGAPGEGEAPGLLLLDGQQRLTSLYHCFQGSGLVDTVDFRSKKIQRRFFVDVRTAVADSVMPQEAVFAVDEHGVVDSHFAPAVEGSLNDREVALRAGCIPVSALLTGEGSAMLFDMAALDDVELRDAVKVFNAKIATPLTAYDVPMIRLARDTERAGVGSIFALANITGLTLDAFDLLGSVFALDDEDFNLTEDWASIEVELRKHAVLEGVDRNRFLMAVSLWVTSQQGRARCQREDVINLELADYRRAVTPVLEGFRRTVEFLDKRSIFLAEEVPYAAQLVPLAIILANLQDSPEALESERGRDRLNRWFWSGVFGELYGSSAVLIRSGRDVDEVVAWVQDEDPEAPEPKTVQDASFAESRLLSVDKHSGVWQGIYALLMARGARDWRTGSEFSKENVESLEPEFQQVYPSRWCEDNGVDSVLAQSVMNYTPMGKRTEIILDGSGPSRYLGRVQTKSLMEDDEFDDVLRSHEMTPEYLFNGDVQAFFADRRHRFVGLVEYAMDKPVIRDVDDSNYLAGGEGPGAFA